jgi:hypothetical protein
MPGDNFLIIEWDYITICTPWRYHTLVQILFFSLHIAFSVFKFFQQIKKSLKMIFFILTSAKNIEV